MTPPESLSLSSLAALTADAFPASLGWTSQHSLGGAPKLIQWHKSNELTSPDLLNSWKPSDAQRNFAFDYPDLGGTIFPSSFRAGSSAWLATSHCRHEASSILVRRVFDKGACGSFCRFRMANLKIGHVTSTSGKRLIKHLAKWIPFYTFLQVPCKTP